MNGLDILLIIPLIWGGYNGLKKGFIVELISSSLLVFGFIKGVALFYTLLPIIKDKLPTLAPCLPVCLAVLMLLIGGGVIYLLTKLIKGMLAISLLGIFDNLLGGVFGLCKVSFFISLLIYCCSCLSITSFPSMYTHNSLLFPLLEPIVPKVLQSFTSIHHLDAFKQWCSWPSA
ncbi:MAG: CvpA family protein [Candidatus Cardinium sp.]|uniref:CvpA family protein n=1 Tax=Cardinium endosymbiont of Dermatophagoides farinae TaxID=2597823 RepID=UPI0011832234|nr:CvpA family protein [Cardinium endosymbiont of Dermatophagoides farinae]TSJ81310.1 CvpA family protein [Cardinium endosymbiont of Dermatophagoides farinae]UWW97373.1 MAG: CvpA family protein [Candidatus Cardinium sp.]